MPEIVIVAGTVARPFPLVHSLLRLKRRAQFLGNYLFQAVAPEPNSERLPVWVQERPRFHGQQQGLIDRDLELDAAQRRSMPRKLDLDQKRFLPGGVSIPFRPASERNGKRSVFPQKRLSLPRHLCHYLLKRISARTAEGGEIEVNRKAIIAEVGLVKGRATFEHQGVPQVAMRENGC